MSQGSSTVCNFRFLKPFILYVKQIFLFTHQNDDNVDDTCVKITLL